MLSTLRALVLRRSSSMLARNAGWMLVGQGLSLTIQALYFLVIARLLGSDEYGVVVGATAVVGIVSQYSSLGSGMVMLRYVSTDRGRFRECWGNSLLTTLTVGLFITALLQVCGTRLVGNRAGQLVAILAVGDCIFAKIAECAGQAFQAFEKLKITAIITLCVNCFRLVVAGVMLASLHHATAKQWAYASMVIAGAGCSAALYAVTTQLGLPLFRPKLLLQYVGEGFGFSFAYSTTSIYNDIDKVMLSKYGMAKANGIYSMAYKLIDISTIPIRSLHSAALPRFFQFGSRSVEQSMQLAKKLLRSTFTYAVFAAPLIAASANLAPIVLGSGFSESTHALRWLCCIPIFRSLHLSAGDAITGLGHQKYRTASQLTAAGFNFTLNLFLIPRFSWEGAAAASLLTDGLLAASNWLVLTMFYRRERLRIANKTPLEVVEEEQENNPVR